MCFDDLKKLIHLAHSENIQVSAKALHITPGALSKTLKKTESQLHTLLFDRVGRNIQLNAQGKKFIHYAISLTHEFEQMRSEFLDNKCQYHLKVSGPAVLLDASLHKIMPLTTRNNIELSADALYEGEALKRVIGGQSHLAIVTDEVLNDLSALGLSSLSLGQTKYEVVAGRHHKVFSSFPDGRITIKDLLNFAFICPKTSPFCGIERGVGSDGWFDHQFPRRIHSRSDDLNVLLSIVKHSQSLAYIPDTLLNTESLRVINVIDYPHAYTESYSLVYRASNADGWLNQLIKNI